MVQRGQVLALKSSSGGGVCWAYRYRIGGRGSKRVQRGGFPSEQAAAEALERALDRLRQEQGLADGMTLSDLVEAYLAEHDAEPETIEKLRWLLTKSTRSFGDLRSLSADRPRSPRGR